jgi:hypothetical protein
MHMLTLKLPELDRVPSNQRSDVLRRCLDSHEMKQFRTRWARYSIVFAAALAALAAVAADLLLHWPLFVTVPAAGATVILTLIAAQFLKPFAEYRLVRRLLRNSNI